ncbi:PD-(D/E)XK nuclease superfamily protein [Rubripirellula lacrimiformis]|uniref:CRISPR-associated exonuclease Cas4 n=1 Tax=Rubripirellula lacrimiformis TaxID=1930273 RepID=A0A517NAH8_9BACT|nr:CRISPR-associated protein Cas4 [Rubripirellula lacrimiformis]QDT04139.1 PD-(D/E)XK nuclease superfamily protein [Rubripirellula lacrimiformis]
MTYHDDELLPISALQHYLFCPRQCALIHLEQVWAENQLTMEGLLLHERADSPTHETRPQHDGVRIRVERALPIRSLELGLIGKADIVEFHHPRDSSDSPRIIPVEYKRGKPKANDCDRVQLCAQALCLEEMCSTGVTEGALFYGTRRRRTEVVFDDDLRRRTMQTIDALRTMIEGRVTPPAVRTKACEKCSLIDLCLPDATGGDRSVARFMSRQLNAHLQDETTDE